MEGKTVPGGEDVKLGRTFFCVKKSSLTVCVLGRVLLAVHGWAAGQNLPPVEIKVV